MHFYCHWFDMTGDQIYDQVLQQIYVIVNKFYFPGKSFNKCIQIKCGYRELGLYKFTDKTNFFLFRSNANPKLNYYGFNKQIIYGGIKFATIKFYCITYS